MLRGHPVDLQEQRGNRDGDIAEHKDREGKQVGHQAPLLSAMNVLVLKDGREQDNSLAPVGCPLSFLRPPIHKYLQSASVLDTS